MSNIKSVLVEYENSIDSKINTNSGLLFSDKFVLITSHLLIELLRNPLIFNCLKSDKTTGLQTIEKLTKTPISIQVISTEKNTNVKNNNEFIVCAYFISHHIRNSAGSVLSNWSLLDVTDNTEMSRRDSRAMLPLLSVFFVLHARNSNVDFNDINMDSGFINLNYGFNDLNNGFEDLKDSLGQLSKSCGQLEDVNLTDMVCVESTPFGNRHFLGSFSQGIISNKLGEKNCFILTDCPTVAGCEGGVMFLKKNNDNEINLTPIGVVLISFSWWKGEWIGLTLGVNLKVLLSELICDKRFEYNPNINKTLVNTYRGNNKHNLDGIMNSIVQVTTKDSWGTAVLLDKNKGLFLTNSHVVINNSIIKMHWQNLHFDGIVIYRTPNEMIFDLAVIKCTDTSLSDLLDSEMQSVNLCRRHLRIGERIFAAGYPLFETAPPAATITTGHVSLCNVAMVTTTCNVLPGASGGGLFTMDTTNNQSCYQLAGVVVCNTRGPQGVNYPRVNMAVPVMAIVDVIDRFLTTSDVAVLNGLHRTNYETYKFWNLLSSKL